MFFKYYNEQIGTHTVRVKKSSVGA